MIKKLSKKLKGSLQRKVREYKIHAQFRKELASLHKEIAALPDDHNPSLPEAAAVLLSYKRPKNLPLIAKSLLKNKYISRVIISNNNPEVRMQDWFDFEDERLEIVNQKVRRLPGYRFEIARQLKEQYFICIDDDLFLRPSQITTLYQALVNDPASPHGIWGQKFYTGESGRLTWKDGIRDYSGDIDVINRAYFFTQAHIANFVQILHVIGIQRIEDLQFVDDIVLSFSGKGRPKCHDVGRLINCPSKDMEGVAVWRQNDFFADRIQFYEQMVSLKHRVTSVVD